MQPNPQKRERPAGTGRDSRQNYRVANDSRINALASSRPAGQVDPISVLLPKLERVRQHGPGRWRADCPLGHTSKGTLSITTGDDGRLLMKCFAGCEPVDILGTIGMDVADMFPTRAAALSPASKRERRELAGMAHWRAALAVLAMEATVVHLAASLLQQGTPLDDVDGDRLALACARIDDAALVLVEAKRWQPDCAYPLSRLVAIKRDAVSELRRQLDAAEHALATVKAAVSP